ncbi:MAG: hypothetical protein ACXWH7_01075, partial [Thermoanaerobaculia bacterium]
RDIVEEARRSRWRRRAEIRAALDFFTASERGARLEPRAFARQGTVKVHLRAIFEKLSVYARENALL